MRVLAFVTLSLLLINPAFAGKGRKPCSGSKGGIKHCTVDHKFMCRDGSVSGSKKKCVG